MAERDTDRDELLDWLRGEERYYRRSNYRTLADRAARWAAFVESAVAVSGEEAGTIFAALVCAAPRMDTKEWRDAMYALAPRYEELLARRKAGVGR